MARKSKTDVELGRMRSFWDIVKELKGSYGVEVVTTMYPSERPGVFIIRLQAGQSRRVAGGMQGPHSIQFEFPNAHAISLATALDTYTYKLLDMYADGDGPWGGETFTGD
jgi:hypothetical protein